jgi:hypothetical protein
MNDKAVVAAHGEQFYDAAATIYVNFYVSELQIIDLCGKWIPRRTRLREKFFLVHHAADEIRHSEMFEAGFTRLGGQMSEQVIGKYLVEDMGDRFDKLQQSEDELEVLLGLNLYAEGVLAMLELEQLGRNMPKVFPDFLRIATDEKIHLAYGKKVMERMLKEDPSNVARALAIAKGYRAHLDEYLWSSIDNLITYGVSVGALDANYREQAIERFEVLMDTLGLDVRSPGMAPVLA